MATLPELADRELLNHYGAFSRELRMTIERPNQDPIRRSDEGRLFALGFADVRIVLNGNDTGGAFAMSQQSLKPRALAGPLHRHVNEDSFMCSREQSGHI